MRKEIEVKNTKGPGYIEPGLGESSIFDISNLGGDGGELHVLDQRNLRSQKIRQDRFSLCDENLILKLSGDRYSILNFSPFGIAVQGEDDQIRSGDEIHGEIYLKDTFLFDLTIRKKRTAKLPAGRIFIGFEVVGKPINVEYLSALISCRKMIEKIKSDVDEQGQLPQSFRLEVFSLKIQLERLENKVNELSLQFSGLTGKDLDEFEMAVAGSVASYLTSVLVPKFNKFSSDLSFMSPELKGKSLEFFRSQLGDFILKAPFANRSLIKPLGYAGDFEVMNLIYRDQPEGATLFGKCLHRHFIDQPAARSVRNRVEYIISHLDAVKCISTSDPIRILSVASGPAVELQKWLSSFKKNEEKIEIELFDQDALSLKHAQKHLMRIISENKTNCKISFINNSVRKILSKGNLSPSFDVIYSLGLFDYLSDNMCQALGVKLFSMLKDGGRMVIGNFNIDNPTRPIMELALDWNLIYRSRNELREIFAPTGGRIEIECEREGVNLFCVIRK